MKKPLIASLTLTIALSLGFGSAVAGVSDEDFDFETTEDLYQICSTPADAPEYLAAHFACRAFIEATVQYHDGITRRNGQMKPLICYSKGTTIADGKKAFVAWGKASAGDEKLMNEKPVKGLLRALSAAYPCR